MSLVWLPTQIVGFVMVCSLMAGDVGFEIPFKYGSSERFKTSSNPTSFLDNSKVPWWSDTASWPHKECAPEFGWRVWNGSWKIKRLGRCWHWVLGLSWSRSLGVVNKNPHWVPFISPGLLVTLPLMVTKYMFDQQLGRDTPQPTARFWDHVPWVHLGRGAGAPKAGRFSMVFLGDLFSQKINILSRLAVVFSIVSMQSRKPSALDIAWPELGHRVGGGGGWLGDS